MRRRTVTLTAMLLVLAAPDSASADTAIGFDEAGYAGQALTTQYQGSGVTFSSCAGTSTPNQIGSDATARSAPNTVNLSACGVDHNPTQMTATFSSPQNRVSLWARGGSLDQTQPAVLTAYDSGGGVVATASLSVFNAEWKSLAVAQPTGEAARIAYVIVGRQNDVPLRIDDFGFGADGQTGGGGAGGSQPPPGNPLVIREPFRGLGHGPHFYRRPNLKARRFFDMPPSRLYKAYTEHLGPLITAPGHGGVNDLGGGLGIRGTDLGNPFEVNGRLALLFGDSWTVEGQGAWDSDSLAWTTARGVGRFGIPKLNWDRQPNGGQFNPLLAWCPITCEDIIGGKRPLGWQSDYPFPLIHDGGMEVPVEGIQIGRKVYIFYVNQFYEGTTIEAKACCQRYDYSVLAEGPASNLQASHLQADHIWGTERFLNVNAVRYRNWIYIYGAANPYRNSSIALARVRPADIADRSKWTYYRGIRNGRPDFRPDETWAQYMIPERCVGEFSVRRYAPLGLFMMAYGCGDKLNHKGPSQRGYYMRFSRTPWGPWTEREEIMKEASPLDGGYGVTMHKRVAPDDKKPAFDPATQTWQLPDDGLSEPDHLSGWDSWGGEYGPYLVPRWFRKVRRGVYQIVWLHSSWHPYKVHLMRTTMYTPGTTPPKRPNYGSNVKNPVLENGDFANGVNGWHTLDAGIPGVSLRSPFHVVSAKGRQYVTSYDHGGAGDGGVGALYQDFTPSSRTCYVDFRVHGGHGTTAGFQQGNVAAVRLYHRGQIVRETFGLDDNDRDVNARWNIEEFRGEPLRLAIVDTATDPWGFISATGFRVVNRRPIGRIRRGEVLRCP